MTEPSAPGFVVRSWLVKAQHDLELARRALDPPSLSDLAAFHTQQAVEKALKGYLTWHNIVFAKTHDLVGLLELCEPIDSGFQALRSTAEALNEYATEPRYPRLQPDPTPAEASSALQDAHVAYDFVLERLPPEVHP